VIVLETLALRWYAFGFIAVFLWAALPERGWMRALRFLLIAAVVEGIAEYTSTHYGFPFGEYTYVAHTRGDELYLSNIPLFVPLSFGVAVWAARSVARVGLRADSGARLVVVGALTAAVIDLVIDPMTLRGSEWFMGSLYSYEASGGWFGVPWSNFGGWVLTSAAILFLDEAFDARAAPVVPSVRGVLLAAVICGFFVVVALATGQFGVALGSVLVVGGLAVLTVPEVRRHSTGTPSRTARN